ncbi:MAG: hypothetical protein KDC38_16910 [Planctomycetes bacterium]|nr:hypothetical protein [Planctomycetota bacterium]
MSDHWRLGSKFACLVLGCLLMWRVSQLFAGDAAESVIRQDIDTLALMVAKAEKAVDRENVALPDEFRAAAGSRAFGAKPPQKEKKNEPKAKPQPSLVGIAGNLAFVKLPSGTVVALREGESNDGVKVARIGVNRVLVEHEEKTLELMIFAGFGSTSLLPPPEETSTEASEPVDSTGSHERSDDSETRDPQDNEEAPTGGPGDGAPKQKNPKESGEDH